MIKNKQLLIEKVKSAFNLITHKKTVKSARITYQVIWSLFLIFVIVLILGGSFGAGVGAGYFASLVKDEPIRSYSSMKKDIYNYTETSDFYYSNNVYLGKLRSDLEREEVKLDQVSGYLVKAVVATEDEYFYQHKGVVPKSIFRAVFQEVTNSSVQTGGSTLTQQLIKNQILTNEVSFQRKANEILLALRLEKFFTKKEILEAYLNVSTFGRNSSGRNIAGVQSAAKGLFGKDAKQLTLPEAAFIAGLPQSPFGYTPFTREGKLKNNLQPGISRMKVVLKRMADGGYITTNQYKTAVAYDITKDFISPRVNPVEKYPWLTFEIEKRSAEVLATVLAEKDGITEKVLKKDNKLYNNYLTLANHDLHQKGYEIHTTIDKDIYDAMQKAKDHYPYFGPDKEQITKDPETGEKITVMEPVEVGAMLIENKTGKIISFVGGRDYKKQQLNHATSSIRQNGSTMKPLLVYGPAFELGKASPGTPLPDVALKLNPADPSNPWPHNYDLRYSGIVSARVALTKSINVPAVKLYKDIMALHPTKYLEKMGFTSLINDDYTNPSTAIGSLKNGVTVEENTNAFSTFANDGKFIDAYLIDKIVDKHGKVVYQHQVKPVTVFTPQTSFLTLDMMRDVIKKGTAAGINGRLKFHTDWAGKTGTGNQYIDSWFVATNPNVTFGIWTGYDTPKSLQARGNLTYSQRTNNLWVDLINAAYTVKPTLIDPKGTFKMPSGIVRRSICSVSGLLPSKACSQAGLIASDYFNAKYVPTKIDDSLTYGKFVQIGDKKYLAMAKTPADFAQQGLILNPDFITRMVGKNFNDYSQLIPKKDQWGKILVPSAEIKENGKTPSAVGLTNTGDVLKWSAVPESDVIGYRVYTSGILSTRVESIKSGSNLSFTAPNGTYYVTTVDIAGNESPPSNQIVIGSAH
ncbi:transglycosylase domain-containing protein [Neobacillus sp. PS3-40]|uniref:transglycosylase domain-containing protein n=1 Tax=Neobacillus sp. PS3-40 TaxID=3070679 RepID=UPI0027DFF334|nr:transglycosylase domain-containing protein [Neobacillus sp. PS3-40]WML45675.1 transglycosylase domain-containing protein [Neobacillus sp. PS3-40]